MDPDTSVIFGMQSKRLALLYSKAKLCITHRTQMNSAFVSNIPCAILYNISIYVDFRVDQRVHESWFYFAKTFGDVDGYKCCLMLFVLRRWSPDLGEWKCTIWTICQRLHLTQTPKYFVLSRAIGQQKRH